MNIPKLILTTLVSVTISAASIRAQDLPSDLTAISQADVPMFATYYSIAYWPDYPPLPCNGFDPSGTCYYSPTYGTSYIWVDDRAFVAGRMLTDSDNPLIPGGGDGGGSDPGPPPESQIDYGTNLWIQIVGVTNQLTDGGTQQVANLFLRNTTAGIACNLPEEGLCNFQSPSSLNSPRYSNTRRAWENYSRQSEYCYFPLPPWRRRAPFNLLGMATPIIFKPLFKLLVRKCNRGPTFRAICF